MGKYYDQLRNQKDEYDNYYHNEYYNHPWNKKQKHDKSHILQVSPGLMSPTSEELPNSQRNNLEQTNNRMDEMMQQLEDRLLQDRLLQNPSFQGLVLQNPLLRDFLNRLLEFKIYPRHPFDPTASNVRVTNGCIIHPGFPDDHSGAKDLVFDGIRADKTTPVYAMEAGTIVDVRRDSPPCPDPNNCPGFANRILIRGDDGAYTEYAHISGPIARPPFILFVEYLRRISVGSRVSAGQLLGYVDNSGVTTGPNLHIARFTSGDATTYFERPTCDWSIQGVNE